MTAGGGARRAALPDVRRHGNRRGAAGFTLLELVLVMAIAAMLVAVTPPLLSRAMPGLELKSATRNIAAGLRFARAQAIRTHRDTTFDLDVEQRWFSVSGQRRRKSLPPRLQLQLVTAESELRGEQAGAIRFFPDGSSTGGRISVSYDKRGFNVGVEWLTGQVRITEAPPP